MNKFEILESDGVETRHVHGASVSTLIPFLNPQIPWVWILGHMPNQHVEWWETSLPINKQNTLVNAEFRVVGYDFMLPTEQFMKIAPELEDHGLVLIQSSQRMPSTLDLSRIPNDQQSKVLRSNGAFLRIYLPHAIETAQIQCFEKGYLANIVTLNQQSSLRT